jgi:hypothetical protein
MFALRRRLLACALLLPLVARAAGVSMAFGEKIRRSVSIRNTWETLKTSAPTRQAAQSRLTRQQHAQHARFRHRR